MRLLEVTKVIEGPMAGVLYTAKSLPCPDCGEQLTIDISPERLYKYNQGALIHEVLPTLERKDAERFITGLCPDCWGDLFSAEDDDTEEDDD